MLLERIIREVDYLTWFSNVVLVIFSCGASQMCVTFTNLNKTCLVPSNDLLIDVIVRYNAMNLLDAYSGYHQIQMSFKDEEKMTFIIECITFFYKRIPFNLQNVGVTYQRLVNKMFEGLLGRNM